MFDLVPEGACEQLRFGASYERPASITVEYNKVVEGCARLIGESAKRAHHGRQPSAVDDLPPGRSRVQFVPLRQLHDCAQESKVVFPILQYKFELFSQHGDCGRQRQRRRIVIPAGRTGVDTDLARGREPDFGLITALDSQIAASGYVLVASRAPPFIGRAILKLDTMPSL